MCLSPGFESHAKFCLNESFVGSEVLFLKILYNWPPPLQFVIQVRVQVHICPLPVLHTPQVLVFMKFPIKIIRYRVPSLFEVRTLIPDQVCGLI